MDACLEAGQKLADPSEYPTAPFASLVDCTSRKALILATEKQITADVNSVAGKDRAGIAACVRADHSLTGAAAAILDGLPGDVAAGIAMRYYAGFLCMAKALREKAAGGRGLPDILLTAEDRANEAKAIEARAAKDAVYAAGARFGPWGLIRRGQKVFDNGLEASFKESYLAEYYAQTTV
jgi:hypothetical protein